MTHRDPVPFIAALIGDRQTLTEATTALLPRPFVRGDGGAFEAALAEAVDAIEALRGKTQFH